MNYNDIDARLKCIYAAIDRQNKYGPEVLSSVRTKTVEEPNGKFQVSLTFGGDENDPETMNQINSVISNLANLKDCLKDKMREQGKNTQLIEEAIDKSPALQLILDLHNQEKHGYPLKKMRRSRKDPRITNVYGALTTSIKPDNVTYQASNGAKALNVMISIRADITDAQGRVLYSLDRLVDQALNDWERILAGHQIIEPNRG